MDTIKTAAVVALLLAVLYGIYVVVNRQDPAPPPEVAEMMKELEDGDRLVPPAIDDGTASTAPAEGVSSLDGSTKRGSTSTSQRAGRATPGDNGPRVIVQVEPPEAVEPALPELPPTPPAVAANLPPRTEPISGPPLPPPTPPITPPPQRLPAVEGGARTATEAAAAPAEPTHAEQEGAVARGQTVWPDASTAGRSYAAESSTSESLPPFQASRGMPVNSRWAANTPSQEVVEPGVYAQDQRTITQVPNSPADISGRNTELATDFSQQANRSSTSASSAAGSTGQSSASLADAVNNAHLLIKDRKFREALQSLSAAYRTHQANASAADRQAALDVLDPLAAAVIYSRYHFLEPPHRVRVGETLEQIAATYQVPWQLLSNINGIADPQALPVGGELKVVRGPFQAVIELSRGELTLYLNDLYAGRFPIGIGNDPFPAVGEYLVLSKHQGRTYYAADGRIVPPHDPQNPYGSVWIDLGTNGACIHGSPRSGPGASSGCISLSPKDAEDLFAILSVGSRVTIRP